MTALESILNRVRTGDDGSFELVGLPRPGEDGDREGGLEAFYRSLVFITAFAPDELLSLGGLAVEESERPGGFALDAALARGDDLVLVGAKRESHVDVALRLEDRDGFPVRAWTRTVAFDPEGRASVGVVGRHLRQPRFFPSSSLTLPQEEWVRVLLAPEGYRWQEFEWSSAEAEAVQLEPFVPDTVRVRLERSSGAPLAGRVVHVQVPFFADEPLGRVVVGTTDSEGTLDVSFLPPGRHRLIVSAPGDLKVADAGAYVPRGTERTPEGERLEITLGTWPELHEVTLESER